MVLIDYLGGCAKEEVYSRMQSVGETLAEFGRALIRLHQRI